MPRQTDLPRPSWRPAVDLPMVWRPSRAVGRPDAGRLVRGVRLPPEGIDFWTYDWGNRATPNRPWRRWGTDRLVRTVLAVLARTAPPTRWRRASASRTSAAPRRRIRPRVRRPRPRVAPERPGRGHRLPAARRAQRRSATTGRSPRCSPRTSSTFVAAGAAKCSPARGSASTAARGGRRAARPPRRPHARADPLRDAAAPTLSRLVHRQTRRSPACSSPRAGRRSAARGPRAPRRPERPSEPDRERAGRRRGGGGPRRGADQTCTRRCAVATPPPDTPRRRASRHPVRRAQPGIVS